MFEKVTARLEKLATDSSRVAQSLRETATDVRTTLREIEDEVERGTSKIEGRLNETRERAREAKDDVSSTVDEMLQKTGDQFDDLRHMLEDASGPFAEELKLQLDLLEVAGTTVEDIIRLFGDAKIGSESLRDILQGADFGKFRKDIQDLIQELGSGALQVDELLRFLNERGGQFGQTVAGWIQSLQKGEISLQRFRELIEGLQKQFEGTEFEDFLDEIEDTIQRGLV